MDKVIIKKSELLNLSRDVCKHSTNFDYKSKEKHTLNNSRSMQNLTLLKDSKRGRMIPKSRFGKPDLH